MNHVEALPVLIATNNLTELTNMARLADACGKDLEIVVTHQGENGLFEIMVLPIGDYPILEMRDVSASQLQLKIRGLELRFPTATVIYA